MKVEVSGKGLDVGESLTNHVKSKVTEHVEKYLDRVTEATVVFSKEAHFIRADVTMNTGTHSHLIIRGKGEGTDAYIAFASALEKTDKQLRKYKERIKNHHKEKLADINATKYILSSADEEVSTEKDYPLVIAEKDTAVETLTVSQAVMKMDLADLPALMFYNSASGRINVVYKRQDGNISWVDPKLAA